MKEVYYVNSNKIEKFNSKLRKFQKSVLQQGKFAKTIKEI